MSAPDPAEAAAAPADAAPDPEAFVLRARPRPAVRFRRGVIVAGAAGVAGTLAVLAWLALEPPAFRLAAKGDDLSAPDRETLPDALANAPADYGAVPRLGPPLPGDLGRPILAHQRALGETDGAGTDPAREAAAAERERREAERRAARTSPLLASTGTGRQGAGADGAGKAAQATASPDEAAGARAESGLEPPPSPWTLSAGTVIPASLITGLDSSLPGTVLAQVTENVRDSRTGRTVLVPQGARLIGSYESTVAFGQRRAMLVWHRIVYPDGASVALDAVPATDAAGYAGLEDRVDVHTSRLLAGVALSTLLGVGGEATLGEGGHGLLRAIRDAAQDSAGRAGEQITARNLDIAPTITVRPGWPVRAIVTRDLVLEPWKGPRP